MRLPLRRDFQSIRAAPPICAALLCFLCFPTHANHGISLVIGVVRIAQQSIRSELELEEFVAELALVAHAAVATVNTGEDKKYRRSDQLLLLQRVGCISSWSSHTSTLRVALQRVG